MKSARRQQVGNKTPDFGKVPSRPSYYEHAKSRIMATVKHGTGEGWNYDIDVIPGIAKWSGVRYYLGGFYKTDAVIAAVDDLLAEGKLLEIWWHDGSRRIEPKHWLILPECMEELPGIHRIKGRLDLVPEHIIDSLKNRA